MLIKSLIIGLLTLSVVIGGVYGMTVIKLMPNNTDVLGVNYGDYYYTIVIERGQIKKVELNGQEDVQHVINADKEKIHYLVENYQEMNKIELIEYLNKDLGIPYEVIMDLAGNFMAKKGG